MELNNLNARHFSDKQKTINKGVQRRFTVLLTNQAGDRITITTNNPTCRQLVMGEGLTMRMTNPQMGLNHQAAAAIVDEE